MSDVYQRDQSGAAATQASTKLLKWHWPNSFKIVSACGHVIIDDATRRNASDVPKHVRCNAAGCKEKWDRL